MRGSVRRYTGKAARRVVAPRESSANPAKVGAIVAAKIVRPRLLQGGEAGVAGEGKHVVPDEGFALKPDGGLIGVNG